MRTEPFIIRVEVSYQEGNHNILWSDVMPLSRRFLIALRYQDCLEYAN